jgi:FkbM family methyltransferase
MRNTITVKPSFDSAVYWQNHRVVMTDDSVGGKARMAMHTQDNAQVSWLRGITSGFPCSLVDVGGNVGLFTRQALIAVPSIAKAYVYEPDEQNFSNLLHNLQPWLDRVEFFNIALDRATGTAEFFHDHDNCGNYSLLRSAMEQSQFSKTKVYTINASVESCRWLDGRPLIYKSDTQGYDETIATLVEPRIWDHVFAAILEIWRIEKPLYDVEAFRKILSRFECRRLLPYVDNLTVDQVLNFSQGNDGMWLDLVLSQPCA